MNILKQSERPVSFGRSFGKRACFIRKIVRKKGLFRSECGGAQQIQQKNRVTYGIACHSRAKQSRQMRIRCVGGCCRGYVVWGGAAVAMGCRRVLYGVSDVGGDDVCCRWEGVSVGAAEARGRRWGLQGTGVSVGAAEDAVCRWVLQGQCLLAVTATRSQLLQSPLHYSYLYDVQSRAQLLQLQPLSAQQHLQIGPSHEPLPQIQIRPFQVQPEEICPDGSSTRTGCCA